MKILGVTLARGGSKGVPGKNTRLLAGKPLIEYTIREALYSNLITDYIVSTDDHGIAELARSLGARVPFLRPAKLAQDTSTSVDALRHAVNFVENEKKITFDFVIELMVTNPFKNHFDIDNSLKLIDESGADSVIAMSQVHDGHPMRLKKIVDGRIEDFCLPEPLEGRRQDLKPEAFIRCGAIYAIRRDELMIAGRRYGSMHSLPIMLGFKESVNIDTENDFLLAEALMSRLEKAK